MSEQEVEQEVEKPKITVSHSEVDSYLRCERAWFYGYGMGIQRKSESASLQRGTLGHAALDVYFNAIMQGKSIPDAQEETRQFLIQSLVADPFLADMVREVSQCLEWFYEANPFLGWQILAVEKEFNLSVTETFEFPLVIDLIARDPYGNVWIIDHKFMYDFLTEKDAELQSQLPKYLGALRALGFKVDKVGYNIFRTRQLKVETVDSKFHFYEMTVTDERVQRTFIEQAITAQRVQEIKQLPIEQQSYISVRTQNKLVCNSCSFRSICVAELNNYQPGLVLDSEYKKRERREFESAVADRLQIES